MEKQNKKTIENKDNNCKTCKGYGYIKTGSDVKPYTLCYRCKGEPLEDNE